MLSTNEGVGRGLTVEVEELRINDDNVSRYQDYLSRCIIYAPCCFCTLASTDPGKMHFGRIYSM